MSARILVVDDEPRVGRLLRNALEEDQLRVEVCSDPEHALRLLEQREFEVIVTDLEMQRIDGLELLRRAKAIHPTCEVIVMTGYASLQATQEALRCGAVDVLQKPFSIDEELKPLIRTLLDCPASRRSEADRRDPALDAGVEPRLKPFAGS